MGTGCATGKAETWKPASSKGAPSGNGTSSISGRPSASRRASKSGNRGPDGVRVLLAHLKPAYRGEIIAELSRRVGDAVEFLEPGAWVDLGQ